MGKDNEIDRIIRLLLLLDEKTLQKVYYLLLYM